MKFLLYLTAVVLLYQRSDARPGDMHSLVSAKTPDVLLDTISQSIICRRELNLNAHAMAEASREGFLPEDDEVVKAYFGCIWKKKGIINDAAEVNRDHFRTYLRDLFSMGVDVTEAHTELADYIVSQCSDLEASHYGQKVVKMNNCVFKIMYEL